MSTLVTDIASPQMTSQHITTGVILGIARRLAPGRPDHVWDIADEPPLLEAREVPDMDRFLSLTGSIGRV